MLLNRSYRLELDDDVESTSLLLRLVDTPSFNSNSPLAAAISEISTLVTFVERALLVLGTPHFLILYEHYIRNIIYVNEYM